MIDTTQILLISVVTILTIIISGIGIHIVFILQEAKRSLERTTKILDDIGVVSGGVSSSLSSMSGLVSGLKTGMSLVNLFQSKKESGEHKTHHGQ